MSRLSPRTTGGKLLWPPQTPRPQRVVQGHVGACIFTGTWWTHPSISLPSDPLGGPETFRHFSFSVPSPYHFGSTSAGGCDPSAESFLRTLERTRLHQMPAWPHVRQPSSLTGADQVQGRLSYNNGEVSDPCGRPSDPYWRPNGAVSEPCGRWRDCDA